MRSLQYFLCLTFCPFSGVTFGQNESFEFSNPQAIVLDDNTISALTSAYWRLFKDEMEIRGNMSSAAKNISMCYYFDADGAAKFRRTLFLRGCTRQGHHRLAEQDE